MDNKQDNSNNDDYIKDTISIVESENIADNIKTQEEIKNDKARSTKKKKKIIIIISILILLIISACVVFYGINSHNEKIKKLNDESQRLYEESQRLYEESFNTYINNLEEAKSLIISGGAIAEDLCGLTSNVWHDAIYKDFETDTMKYTRPKGEYVDFNEALSNLYADVPVKEKISEIKNYQDKVNDLMRQLQSPTEEFKTCYGTITDLYVAFSGITKLAINPTGSYTSYKTDIDTKISNFMDAYNKLNTQIPNNK